MARAQLMEAYLARALVSGTTNMVYSVTREEVEGLGIMSDFEWTNGHIEPVQDFTLMVLKFFYLHARIPTFTTHVPTSAMNKIRSFGVRWGLQGDYLAVAAVLLAKELMGVVRRTAPNLPRRITTFVVRDSDVARAISNLKRNLR
jgi:hypothetical protein